MSHEDFWREWEANIRPSREAKVAASEGAVEFAKIGIKSSLVLNGGALIALPAFVEVNHAVGVQFLAFSAGAFAAGLIACATSIFFAYQTMVYQGLYHSHEEARIAADFRGRHHPQTAATEAEIAAEAERDGEAMAKKGEFCRIMGVVAYGGSVATFLVGSMLALGYFWGSS